ncbi:MAG: Hsp20/alpha crystallin family protein [Acidobacteriota bacterium]|nr:Hsp20/alpha crystallin family protein [Thermoanaerobaculaceae bacterium]
MAIRKWNPFHEIMAMQNQLDRLFGETLERGTRGDFDFGSWMPPVDLREENDKLVLEMELPGLKKDDVEISLENNVLTIKGERKFEKEEKKENFHKIERSYGKFSRSFSLPTTVKPDGIDASLKDGILTVSLPFAEEAKPKKISIK